jgi:hypothetical protein
VNDGRSSLHITVSPGKNGMLFLETISVEDKCYPCHSGEEDPSEYTIITQRFTLRKNER